MRRLDRYLARSFMAPFAVSTFGLAGVLIVGEVLAQMNRFVRFSTGFMLTAKTISVIYLLKTPTYVTLIVPITLLVGAAFALTQLSKNNEIVAMKACGVSLMRVLTPVFAAAAILSALSAGVREFVVPRAEQVATPMFYKAVGYQEHFTDILGVSPEPRSTVTEARQAGAQGEPWQVAGADPLYRAKFNFVQNQLRNLDIVLTPGQGDIVHVDAAEARFRGRGEWLLNGVVVDGQRRFSQAVWRTSVRPKDLSLGQVTLSMRPLNEIIRFVRAHPHTPQYRLDLYSRLAYPLTGIILLMLGLPLVLGSERLLRSHLLGTGAAVIVGLLFFGVQFVAYHLGDTGQLPPSAAVLTPVVLGFAAGGFLMDTMRS